MGLFLSRWLYTLCINISDIPKLGAENPGQPCRCVFYVRSTLDPHIMQSGKADEVARIGLTGHRSSLARSECCNMKILQHSVSHNVMLTVWLLHSNDSVVPSNDTNVLSTKCLNFQKLFIAVVDLQHCSGFLLRSLAV